MHSGLRIGQFFLLVILAGGPGLAGADAWEGHLQGGGTVRVDPSTHKPTLYFNGGSTQLWDGVHELDDGSVIIVRDGVAVPDETMLDTWSGQVPPRPGEQVALCEQLARKVCGLDRQCAGERPCDLAEQLRRMEQEEHRQAPYGHTTASTLECRKALGDPAMFPPCAKAAKATATPCGKLVARVCGDRGQCEAAPACDPARQLLSLERAERMESPDPAAPTATGAQCQDAMKNDFFAQCRQ
jgi:hypothetical protein